MASADASTWLHGVALVPDVGGRMLSDYSRCKLSIVRSGYNLAKGHGCKISPGFFFQGTSPGSCYLAHVIA